MIITAVAAMALATVALGPSDSASAASNTISSSATLNGTSATQDKGTFNVMCDTCAPDSFFSCGSGCEMAFGFSVNPTDHVSWQAPIGIDTTYEQNDLRQGTTLNLTDVLSPSPGTIKIRYDVAYTAGLFGRNGDFPAGPDWHPSTATTSGSVGASASAPCTPPLAGAPDATCLVTTSIPVLDTGGVVAGFGLKLSLEITHTFTVSPAGITSDRVVVTSGGAVPPAGLTFSNPVPSVVADPFTVPCNAPTASVVGYNLTNLQYGPTVKVDGSIGIGVTVTTPLPLPDFPLGTIPLISGTVFDAATVPMTGAPEPNLNLGPVLVDNSAPVIDSVGGPYSGSEGSPIAFAATAHDNCGVTLRWDFSDGGVAFGANPLHTFVDNGTYSALLTATDPSGNTATQTLSISVANVNPTVSAGPDRQNDFGRTVAFHANGSDPGALDNASLLYSWDFLDTVDPLGAAGPDVSHVYSQPGVYNAKVTVTDKDGGSSFALVAVTVTKRDVAVSYSGDSAGRITDNVALRASVVDEYGSAVVGRSVGFYFDGGLVASALTDSFGIAQASWAVPLGTTVVGHTIQARFAGDGLYNSGQSASGPFTVSKENTVLTYTGVLKSKPSKPVVLTAKLTDDEGNPIAGKLVTFTLGSQGCSALTNASGIATCTIAKLTQKSGPYLLGTNFAGDGDFNAGSDVDTFTIG
jgi:PKD repeat protein